MGFNLRMVGGRTGVSAGDADTALAGRGGGSIAEDGVLVRTILAFGGAGAASEILLWSPKMPEQEGCPRSEDIHVGKQRSHALLRMSHSATRKQRRQFLFWPSSMQSETHAC